MVFITAQEILETVSMIRSENLDVRAVTMGISLADCSAGETRRTAERIHAKIVRRAGRLVEVAAELQEKYGVPIVNRRVSVTPIADVVGSDDPEAYLEVAHALDAAADEVGIDFLGGFSALVQKGFTRSNTALIEAIPDAIAGTNRVCSSVNVASTRAGINMDAVLRMAEVLLAVSKRTAEHDSIGCAKIVIFCNAPEDNPFMAGAMHGSGEAECSINVAISGPGVVRNVVAANPDASFIELADLIKRTTFKITRVGELIAQEASQMLGAELGIIDLSLAPTPAVGDSIAEILECMGLEAVGAPGTTAALAMLNDAVKKGGTMATSSTGGLSGAFIPVSEDRRNGEGRRRGQPADREARGHDGGLFAGAGHDRRARRHHPRRARRHHRRRDGDRHDQLQDHRRASHPGGGQEGRGLGHARRALRRGAGHEGQHRRQRRVRAERRAHSRASLSVRLDELEARLNRTTPISPAPCSRASYGPGRGSIGLRRLVRPRFSH